MLRLLLEVVYDLSRPIRLQIERFKVFKVLILLLLVVHCRRTAPRVPVHFLGNLAPGIVYVLDEVVVLRVQLLLVGRYPRYVRRPAAVAVHLRHAHPGNTAAGKAIKGPAMAHAGAAYLMIDPWLLRVVVATFASRGQSTESQIINACACKQPQNVYFALMLSQ